MKNYSFDSFKYLMLMTLALALNMGCLLANDQSSHSVRLSDHVPNKGVADAIFLNNLESTREIPLAFTLPLRNQEELQKLVARIYDPQDSEYYHKYLTSEEFIEHFAPTEEDYNKVITYAKSLGFTIHGLHPNRTLLNVSGKASSIESAFNINLFEYQSPKGRKFYAPNNNPEVPSSIASIIRGVVGLDNHAVWHPFHIKKEATQVSSQSNATPESSPSGPGGGFAPGDILRAYNLTNLSAQGSGQVIALFELASYNRSDIDHYTTYFNLPSANLTNVLVDGGSTSGPDAEVVLDIELALAVAPASHIYIYEGPNSYTGVLDTYNRIASDNIAKQVSTSWGLGEDLAGSQFLQAENAIFLQMATQGQSMYAAAGDSGAYDDYPYTGSQRLVVDDPASQPYVVGVGGTSLTVDPNTGNYVSETVWNNGLGNGAGGGGVSQFWPIPSWQQSVSSVYSKTNRNIPDVALDADPYTGYSIYYAGFWSVYGGTSCAAPLWAAFNACVNQALVSAQKPVLGFPNPKLYAIGNGTSYTTDFHDVTSGNNLYYQAHQSYDNATGWGSFNGANLWAALTNSPTPPPPQSPVLNITMHHTDPFIQGSVGTYNIVVSNQGKASTAGPVTVLITLPDGISLHSFSASGWTFIDGKVGFECNDVLQPGASYPPIAITVNVDLNAPSSLATTASVSGGGSVSNTVIDPTTTALTPPPPLAPILNITMQHNDPFIKGSIGTYNIAVSNQGKSSTGGPITLSITLPAGLALIGFYDPGWTFIKGTLGSSGTVSFQRKDALKPGDFYPTMTVTVKVDLNAPSSLTPTAVISGGGSTSSIVTDPTNTQSPKLAAVL